MLHRNKSRANVEKKPEKLIKVNNVRNKDVFVLYYHQKLIYIYILDSDFFFVEGLQK